MPLHGGGLARLPVPWAEGLPGVAQCSAIGTALTLCDIGTALTLCDIGTALTLCYTGCSTCRGAVSGQLLQLCIWPRLLVA
jgi:hypothetical protein